MLLALYPLCGVFQSREERMTELGLSVLRSNPRIVLLGDTGRPRLPVFSFLVRHGDRYEKGYKNTNKLGERLTVLDNDEKTPSPRM